MSLWKIALIGIVSIFWLGAGCGTTEPKDTPATPGEKSPPSQDKDKTDVAQPQGADNKAPPILSGMDEAAQEKVLLLIQARKFFEAYQMLGKAPVKDDWVIAQTLFVSYALQKLEHAGEATPEDMELRRRKAQDLLESKDYYKALELTFSIEPKNDQDVSLIMEASYHLFAESGGQQITQYLATVMAGFMYARATESPEWEKKTQEALAKIKSKEMQVDEKQYKAALVKAARFFKNLGQDFEELTLRHLEKCGYTLSEIQTADFDRRAVLEAKAREGDKYSEIYLWWYVSYQDFEKIIGKLLAE